MLCHLRPGRILGDDDSWFDLRTQIIQFWDCFNHLEGTDRFRIFFGEIFLPPKWCTKIYVMACWRLSRTWTDGPILSNLFIIWYVPISILTPQRPGYFEDQNTPIQVQTHPLEGPSWSLGVEEYPREELEHEITSKPKYLEKFRCCEYSISINFTYTKTSHSCLPNKMVLSYVLQVVHMLWGLPNPPCNSG